MASLLSKLSGTSKSTPIEPREIFMTLPQKDKRYEYPRDVQSEVWKKWFDNRSNKNNIIKMNTGSGKTVVGLMILQSCLNEGNGPAVYVVPDKYLATQVCDEAKQLGIYAVTDRDDYLYTENKAILVMPIHALVNGRSVFGMRPSGNYPIGSILLDDVHACLDTIATQFSLRIDSSHELFSKMILLLKDAWKAYDSTAYTDIVELRDPHKRALLPFWIWQDKQQEIYRLLREYDNDQPANHDIFFSLPLIEDCLSLCSCIITSRAIEITPKGIPISKIKSFETAGRRIFMSATLSDDSVFVSSVGLHPQDISAIITPDRANDIGDRLILFPRHLNSSITDENIRDKVSQLAQKYNVVVIVPSKERGLFWDKSGMRLVTKDNISNAVKALKEHHVGLLVFVNRYDGIDLPDDACRLLIIDGLPPLRSEYDKYIQSIDPSSGLLLREQIQRIEQGMGRGVRSNSDSCCVILMGNDLADVLLRNNGISHFSQATREQYSLSKELWDLLKQEVPSPSIDDIFELADYSLLREVEWIQKSKERLAAVTYNTSPSFNDVSVSLRAAFESACAGQLGKTISTLDSIIHSETNNDSKGRMMQTKAEYINLFDRSKAQQILQAARGYNQGLLVPISGIQYEKLLANMDQAKAIIGYTKEQYTDANQYIIHLNAVMDELVFSPDADGFENALEKVGKLLGFGSSRPDKETCGKGPDNLWALGEGKYFVIECKSGATSSTISKEYCNQLGGSVRWFHSEYGNDFYATPIMVHVSNKIDSLATAVDGMKVITPELLDRLKKQIRDFAAALAQSSNWEDEVKINALLCSYKLRNKDIISNYTIDIK